MTARGGEHLSIEKLSVLQANAGGEMRTHHI